MSSGAGKKRADSSPEFEDARRLRRTDDVVWRCGPDRVLTRRVGDRSDEAASEVFGAAALVWLALDEPATTGEISERLADADVSTDVDWMDGLTRLRSRGLIVDDR